MTRNMVHKCQPGPLQQQAFSVCPWQGRYQGLHREAGFGIVEVLIALLVIAGGLLALSKVQGGLLGGSAGAQQQSEAGFIGQKVIEDLRARGWSSADLAAGSHALPAVNGRSAAFSVRYEVTDNAQPAYKTVVALVNWEDSNGAAQVSRITSRFQKAGADGTVRVLQTGGAGAGGANASAAKSSGSSASSLAGTTPGAAGTPPVAGLGNQAGSPAGNQSR